MVKSKEIQLVLDDRQKLLEIAEHFRAISGLFESLTQEKAAEEQVVPSGASANPPKEKKKSKKRPLDAEQAESTETKKKGHISGYNIFTRVVFKQICDEFPDLSYPERSRVISEMWKTLKDKSKYNEMAVEENQARQKPSPVSSQFKEVTETPEKKSENSESDTPKAVKSEEKEKKKKKKRTQE